MAKDCVVGSKLGSVVGDYCQVTGGQYRCKSGATCCNKGVLPKMVSGNYECEGGLKRLSSDPPELKCDLQGQRVCTGQRKEVIDSWNAGEYGFMNPNRCEEICVLNGKPGCCMYEVDHERCFLVERGATIKVDNAMFYHNHIYNYAGSKAEKVPMRHAGWCEFSAETEVADGEMVALESTIGGGSYEICRDTGVNHAICNKNVADSHPKSCTKCLRGWVYSGVWIFGNHWCCSDADAQSKDCKCGRPAAEGALAFSNGAAPTTFSAVVTYSFAALGASVLVYGAFRHYTDRKSDYTSVVDLA